MNVVYMLTLLSEFVWITQQHSYCRYKPKTEQMKISFVTSTPKKTSQILCHKRRSSDVCKENPLTVATFWQWGSDNEGNIKLQQTDEFIRQNWVNHINSCWNTEFKWISMKQTTNFSTLEQRRSFSFLIVPCWLWMSGFMFFPCHGGIIVYWLFLLFVCLSVCRIKPELLRGFSCKLVEG